MLPIELASSAARELRGLERSVRARVLVKIQALADEPLPPGCQTIKGWRGCYRIRVGDYRIVYKVEETAVLIVKIGHRREVYDRLAGRLRNL